MLFVTAVFRLIARKKIAKLEARLFLQFALQGPTGKSKAYNVLLSEPWSA